MIYPVVGGKTVADAINAQLLRRQKLGGEDEDVGREEVARRERVAA